MQLLRYLFILLMLICYHCPAQETPSCQRVLNCIQNNLPHYGILKKTEEFVYLDLNDEYIHTLIALIQEDGFVEPPYFGKVDLVGAHISIMDSQEVRNYGIKEIQQCGELIYFTPKECKIVHPPRWQEIDEVYIIVVEAPELDRIRNQYGLPMRTYDYHITIGVKPKTVQPVVNKSKKPTYAGLRGREDLAPINCHHELRYHET